MSKTTRKVTVDTSKRSSAEGTTSSGDHSSKTRKKSVFERLGTAGSSYEVKQYDNINMCAYVYVGVYLFVCLSICLFVCLFVCNVPPQLQYYLHI